MHRLAPSGRYPWILTTRPISPAPGVRGLVRKGRFTIGRGARGADRACIATRLRQPVQPNRASSTDERLPDLRAIVAATTLQSLARESLLASLARRQASTYAAPPKSEISASASEEIASRSSWGR